MCITESFFHRLVVTGIAIVALLSAPNAPVRGDESTGEAGSQDELFYFPPQTPDRLVRAAIVAIDLQKPELARQYLRKLIDLAPPDPELAELRKKYGIGLFLRFSCMPELHPEAPSVLDAISNASTRLSASDSAMETFVEQLGGDTETATEAVLQLLAEGDRSVAFLIRADPTTLSGRRANAILQRHARELRTGILEQISTASAPQQTMLIEALNNSGDAEIAWRLLRWEFDSNVAPEVAATASRTISVLWHGQDRPTSPSVAVDYLQRQARDHFRTAGIRFQTSKKPDGQMTGESSPESRLRHLSLATQMAADAVAIRSDDRTSLALAAALEAASTTDALTVDDPQILNDALREAVAAEHSASAAAVLRMLNRKSPAPVEPHLLKTALQFPDIRVRLQAAQAAHQLPDGQLRLFAEQAIRTALTPSPDPQAVVIDPWSDRRADLVAILEENGYAVENSATGSEGFELAAAQLNCDLIMVHTNCIRWDLTPTIANLRSDARTKNIPVLIFGPSKTEAAVQRLMLRYPGLWFVSEPVGSRVFRGPADELIHSDTLTPRLKKIGFPEPQLTEAERRQLHETALQLQSAFQETQLTRVP